MPMTRLARPSDASFVQEMTLIVRKPLRRAGILGLILGPSTASLLRRATGALIVGSYVLCVLLMFWYFYAVLAGQVLPYESWLSHMWYQVGGHGWI